MKRIKFGQFCSKIFERLVLDPVKQQISSIYLKVQSPKINLKLITNLLGSLIGQNCFWPGKGKNKCVKFLFIFSFTKIKEETIWQHMTSHIFSLINHSTLLFSFWACTQNVCCPGRTWSGRGPHSPAGLGGRVAFFFIIPPYCLPSERVHKTPVVLVRHDQVQVHIVQLDSGEGSHPPRVHRHESNHILGHQLGKQAPAICTHGMWDLFVCRKGR